MKEDKGSGTWRGGRGKQKRKEKGKREEGYSSLLKPPLKEKAVSLGRTVSLRAN